MRKAQKMLERELSKVRTRLPLVEDELKRLREEEKDLEQALKKVGKAE